MGETHEKSVEYAKRSVLAAVSMVIGSTRSYSVVAKVLQPVITGGHGVTRGAEKPAFTSLLAFCRRELIVGKARDRQLDA